MASRNWAPVGALIVALALGACTTSVPGQATRGSGQPPASSAKAKPTPVPISARDLLLQDATTTPLGPAIAIPVGDSYFTSVRPPECAAALLFDSSPLLPPAPRIMPIRHTKSTARPCTRSRPTSTPTPWTTTMWCGKALVLSRIVVAGHRCRPAWGLQTDETQLLRQSSDGVLTWTMTRPDWTCDFGLAAIPRVVLLMAAATPNPGSRWRTGRRKEGRN